MPECKKISVKRDSQQGGQEGCKIFDNSDQIQYTGNWVQNTLLATENGSPNNETTHSTGQPGSSIFVSFEGTQFNVTGTIPAGDAAISANYIIDNGTPITKAVTAVAQSSDLIHQNLFISPVLKPGTHNITLQVIQTGSGRNYTFQTFNVMLGGSAESANDNDSPSSPKGGSSSSNAAAIVGGVLASIVVVLLAVLFFWRRKRSARISDTRGQDLPRMYYARPLSGESSFKAPYAFNQPSVLDTDSKFTFAVHNAPTNASRRSWVTVDRPPTIPQSAKLSERDVADWSTYKGSSVIYQPPPQAERSHFSPYTTKTLSSMAFGGVTPRPLSRGATESSRRRESQSSASTLPIRYNSHKF